MKRIVAVLAVLAGCGPSLPDHLGTSHRAISAAKLVSCWVRPADDPNDFYQFDVVQCSAAIGGDSPLPIQLASVRVNSTNDPNLQEELTFRTAEPATIARVKRAQYPLQLHVAVSFGRNGTVVLGNIGQLETTTDLARFDTATVEHPAVFELPFDLWPVEFAVESSVFAATFEPYTLDLAPWKSQPSGATQLAVQGRIDTVVHQGETKTFYVAAPRGQRAPLVGMAIVGRSTTPKIKFELDGPAAYTVTETAITRKPAADGGGASPRTSCDDAWTEDAICDQCLGDDPDCAVGGVDGCQAQWFDDGICDLCLDGDPDCGAGGDACPAAWSGDGICDACLGDDPDCGAPACSDDYYDDGICDACLGDDPDCETVDCPESWRDDGVCDACLGDDPDCDDDAQDACPDYWYGDGVCDACLGDDPDCAADDCPDAWYGDGVCDACLGDDPDCAADACPDDWYGDGWCDECLGDDPDCAPPSDCPPDWYDDGWCDPCLGDDPDCG